MTEHTVTVEETIEKDETVYTCDYCGLGSGAGEMISYEPESTDGNFTMFAETEDETEGMPELHFHMSCIPTVVASEEQAEKITLASQYKRRTGDSLLFVITSMSLVLYAPAIGLLSYGVLYNSILSAVAGGVLMAITLSLSRREAKNTIKEFST